MIKSIKKIYVVILLLIAAVFFLVFSISTSAFGYEVQATNGDNGSMLFDNSIVYNSDCATIEERELEATTSENTTIEINLDKLSTGYFTVKYNDLHNNRNICEVIVDVWSDIKGESSKKTYYDVVNPPSLDYSGCRDIPLLDHENILGVYNIVISIKDIDFKVTQVGTLKSNVNFKFSNLRGTVNNNCTCASVLIDGDILPVNLNIIFLVSSLDSGKADGKWMESVKDGSTYWKGVDLTLYSRIGLYSVSAYIYNEINQQKYLVDEATFNVPAAKFKSINACEYDISGGCFTICVDGLLSVQGFDFDSIKIYVWSDLGGQDDLRLYPCAMQANPDGTYKATCRVFVNSHKFYYGKYNYLLYIKTAANFSAIVAGGNCIFDVGNSDIIASIDKSENNVVMSLTNKNLSTNTKVFFGIYAVDGGSSDIRWVDAKVSYVDFSYNELISYHKALGDYSVQSYCLLASGQWKFLASTVVNYQTKAKIHLTAPDDKIDGTKGKFNLQIDNINSPSGFWRVLLPTFSAFETESSVSWIEPKYVSKGVYAIDVNVSDHFMSFGNYTTNCYIYMNNGCSAKISELITNIQPKNYIGVCYMGNSTYKAASYNIDQIWVNDIKFGTWSESGGKDDYIEYPGQWIPIMYGNARLKFEIIDRQVSILPR